jgi:predicted Zn-dependent protease with MMP-like domain
MSGVVVSEERFEELVADALDAIPDELAREMDNVVVTVEDWPTPDQIGDQGGTLLGQYTGVSLTRRSPTSYNGAMPDVITIFRGPISSMSEDEDDLVELVTTTVIHEVAHHFGISDERLDELGWA